MSRSNPIADPSAYKYIVRAVVQGRVVLHNLLSSTPSLLQSDGVLWELIKEGAVSPDWPEPS